MMILFVLMNPIAFPFFGCFPGGLTTDFVNGGESHPLVFVLGCPSIEIVGDAHVNDLVALAQHILASVSILSHDFKY